MKKITVNGHLVNATLVYNKHVFIPFNEAERLLTTIPDPSFIIYISTWKQVLTLDNLARVRAMELRSFLIRPLGTEGITDSPDIEFALHEVGWDCIDSIKAHLKRLGWLEQYDEQELKRIDLDKVGGIVVEDIYLDKEEVILLYNWLNFGKKESLSSMLIGDRISVDTLIALLKGLENIKPLKILMA